MFKIIAYLVKSISEVFTVVSLLGRGGRGNIQGIHGGANIDNQEQQTRAQIYRIGSGSNCLP